jgi:hypothetical protein
LADASLDHGENADVVVTHALGSLATYASRELERLDRGGWSASSWQNLQAQCTVIHAMLRRNDER